jgi:homocysteine S-methyltransferase
MKVDGADPLAELLARTRVAVLDGALATELERRGFELRDELWSAKVLLEHPEAIRAVHDDYLAAGADILTTASYQATLQGFARRGLRPPEAREALLASVRIACAARDELWSDPAHRKGRVRPLVAASIGSYGAFLADGSEFRGEYAIGARELAEFHRERLAMLASSEADVLAFETIPCLDEALVLSELLRGHPGAFAWLAFSCRDDERTSHGERIEDCAAALESNAQLAAIGVNCTAPRFLESLVTRLASATSKPIVVYPNSGETWDRATRSWHGPHGPLDFANEARKWIAAGARIVGGCCRTTPREIRALDLLRGRA